MYITSCITDFVDGYLARKWQQTTAFGAFIDPVADKLMVATSIVLLGSQFPTLIYMIPVALIMSREIAVSALREWMAAQQLREVVQVGKLGKVKTTLQMVATSILLLVSSSAAKPRDLDLCDLWHLDKASVLLLGMIIFYLATAATLLSGAEYFLAAWPQLTSKSKILTIDTPSQRNDQ